jgi:hypothetical protein
MMTLLRLVPGPKIDNRSDDELLRRAREFYEVMQRRRTIRDFSDRPVPREVIEHCIRAAGTAPSGANLQPWHFVAVSDPALSTKSVPPLRRRKKNSTNIAHRKPGLKRWRPWAPIPTSRSWRLHRG